VLFRMLERSASGTSDKTRSANGFNRAAAQ
jgi:hypothetical protein